MSSIVDATRDIANRIENEMWRISTYAGSIFVFDPWSYICWSIPEEDEDGETTLVNAVSILRDRNWHVNITADQNLEVINPRYSAVYEDECLIGQEDSSLEMKPPDNAKTDSDRAGATIVMVVGGALALIIIAVTWMVYYG